MTGIVLGALAVTVVTLWGYALWRLGVSEHEALAERTALDVVEAGSRRLSHRLEVRVARTPPGRRLRRRIDRAGLSWRVIDVATGLVALAVIVYFAASGFVSWWVAIGLAVLGIRLALAYFDRLETQRREAFVAQLPEVARVLSNATSAGLALRSAVRMAADDMAEPAGSELRQLSQELDFGASMIDALAGMQERLPSRELSLLTRTLIIQARAGGAMVTALREMSETLEARKDLRREIRTMLSGVVFTGWVVMMLGIGSLLLMNLIQPGVLHKMTSSLGGQIVLAVSAGLNVLGFFLIRRTTRIDV